MRAKCKDCLQPIEVWGNRREHLCKACNDRKNNFKYRGIPYIPIKNLSEEEQQKLFNRRKGKSTKNAETKKTTKIIKNSEIDQEQERIERNKKLVLEDIEKTLKSNNIDFKPENYDIYPLMISFKSFLETYLENKDKMNTAKIVYNNMSTDYSHSKERWSTDYLTNFMNYSLEERKEAKDKKEEWEIRHSWLLYFRRLAMYVINQFELVSEFFDSLTEEQKNIFFNMCDKLEQYKTAYDNKKYIAENSSLVASEDFVMGIKENNGTKFIYRIDLKTYGYNQLGKRTMGTFTRTVDATSEREALDKLADFYKGKQFSWTYVESEAEITNLGPVLQTKESSQQ